MFHGQRSFLALLLRTVCPENKRPMGSLRGQTIVFLSLRLIQLIIMITRVSLLTFVMLSTRSPFLIQLRRLELRLLSRRLALLLLQSIPSFP